MTNLITAAALCLSLAAPANGVKPQPKPAPMPPQGTVIVGILPAPNYAVEGETRQDNAAKTDSASKTETPALTADQVYEQMKAKLDEKFKKMFDLKAELDKTQAETSSKWDEYYNMRNVYEKQLKRLIADWTFNSCL